MPDEWSTSIAPLLEVGTPGGAEVFIGAPIPAELATYYAFLDSISQVYIGEYSGDGSYHYEVVGIYTGSSYWATGTVTPDLTVIEYMDSVTDPTHVSPPQMTIGDVKASDFSLYINTFDTTNHTVTLTVLAGNVQIGPAGWGGTHVASFIIGPGYAPVSIRSPVETTDTLTRSDEQFGRVSITPSGASTPTSATVTYPALTGTGSICGYVTANSAVPGTDVQGVSYSSPTSTSLIVWLTRTSITTTTVSWMAKRLP